MNLQYPILDALNVILTGMVIVFLALIALIAIIKIMGIIISKSESRKQTPQAAPAKAPVAPPVAAPVVENGISNETVAAISAAVAVSMQDAPSGYEIKSIKKATNGRPVWGLAGMMNNTKPF